MAPLKTIVFSSGYTICFLLFSQVTGLSDLPYWEKEAFNLLGALPIPAIIYLTDPYVSVAIMWVAGGALLVAFCIVKLFLAGML